MARVSRGTGGRMTWRRKVVMGLVTAAIFFGLLEAAARAYSAIKYGNGSAASYGWSFTRKLFSGSIAPPTEGWGAARGEGDYVEAAAASQALFDHRDTANEHFDPRPPQDVIINGTPAHINSMGYRGPEIAIDPPPGRVRIAAFGESYVFGAYLRDEETWPRRLQDELTARQLPSEVINAGVSGSIVHGVLQEVIRLTNRIKLQMAIVTSAYNNHPLLAIERKYSVATGIDHYLYNLSLFYVMFKEKLARQLRQPVDYGLYHQRLAVRQADVESVIDIYKTRLRQIHTVCRERGTTLVLASQPEVFFDATLNAKSTMDTATIDAITARIAANEPVYLAELEYYLQGRLNLAARQTASELGVLFFDGDAVLSSDKKRYFVDQIHPNEHGAARLAKELADVIEPVVRTELAAIGK